MLSLVCGFYLVFSESPCVVQHLLLAYKAIMVPKNIMSHIFLLLTLETLRKSGKERGALDNFSKISMNAIKKHLRPRPLPYISLSHLSKILNARLALPSASVFSCPPRNSSLVMNLTNKYKYWQNLIPIPVLVQVSTCMTDHLVGCSFYMMPKHMLRPQYQSRAWQWRGLIAIMYAVV